MERRHFLKWLAFASAQPVLFGCATKSIVSPEQAPAMGYGAAPLATAPSGYATTSSASGKGDFFLFLEDDRRTKRILRRFNWDTYETTDFPLPLLYPHSLMQSRHEPHVVYAFEMFGSCARIDLVTKKTLVIDHQTTRQMFYGHASQNAEGNLYCTQVDSDLSRGIVTVRDPATMKVALRLSDECNGAHQVVTLNGGKLAACGVSDDFGKNPKAGGAIAFVDTTTNKVVQHVPLAHPVSHLMPYSENEVVALTIQLTGLPLNPKFENTSRENAPGIAKADPSPIYLVKSDGTHRVFLDGGLTKEFLFNAAFAKVPNSDLMLTSHIGSNRVIVWNKAGQPVKVHTLPHPGVMTVSKDGSEFMVLSDLKAQIYSLKTHEHVKTVTDGMRVIGLAAYKA